MDKEVLVPEIVEDSIELFSNAVESGPESKDFDVARKLLTLATLLGKEAIAPEQAADSADRTMFNKHVAHEVGAEKMSAEDGADKLADREASTFVSASRAFIAEAVETGCEAIGTFIGTQLGSPALGYTIGSAVGHFLNKPVGDMVAHGARRIVSYAKQAWQWAKNTAVSVFEKAVNWVFS